MKHVPRATELQVLGCEVCGLVLSAPEPRRKTFCPRCAAPLHSRKPDSLVRSWAFLLAAAILYVPANLLPILHTNTLLEHDDSTILSGVVELWNNGSWDLAIIVFVASIVVPMLKIATLLLLLITTGRGSIWRQRERTRLYRIVEFIGHWSMLDVFVVVLLVTLVHFGTFAQVDAGSGVLAFGGVVILTMLASMSFDPRLIWDTAPPPAASPPSPPLHS